MKRLSLEAKVGLFAVVALAVILWATLRVTDKGLFTGGSYDVDAVVESAEGLTRKTPVEIAGIQVGYIEKFRLLDNARALVTMRIDKQVRLTKDVRAWVRTKGFLGETYLDLVQGDPDSGMLGPGETITATNPYVDLGQIASDVREVTKSLRDILSTKPDAPLQKILNNMEQFTSKLATITTDNQANVNEMLNNFRQFSVDLRDLMATRRETLAETMDRVNSITRKIDEGQGTVGRLINDDELYDNVNRAARGLSETVGGVNRFQINLGYHLEYMGQINSYKNYVTFQFKPRPDKYFQFDLVADQNPDPTQEVITNQITAGGTTTTVTTNRQVVNRTALLISAQLAKQFYDFVIRGGIIESRGGLGLDYIYPLGALQFDAFDFQTSDGQRPHLKLTGTMNMTRNFYVLGGIDDFISTQGQRSWFLGAGLQFVDDDVKSLLGAFALRR